MYIDIAVNLTDEMFDGVYHGKPRHESDRAAVVTRAFASGCTHLILLAGSLNDADACAAMCAQSESLFTTIGVHPTRCSTLLETSEIALQNRFDNFLKTNPKAIAIGEIGLDYDRLHFCEKHVQIAGFETQLKLASKFEYPLVLHLRNAFEDFVEIMQRTCAGWKRNGAVVHSFTGTRKEMEQLTNMGLYIGLNGCSLRDPEFLQNVVPHIPEELILFETDSPYCDIKPRHPGWAYLLQNPITTCKPDKWVPNTFVKNRNEPALINQVALVVGKARDKDITHIVHANTLRLFKKLVRK